MRSVFFAACEIPEAVLPKFVAATAGFGTESRDLVELLASSAVTGDHRVFAQLLTGPTADAFQKRLLDASTLLVELLGRNGQSNFVLPPELAAYMGNID
jgi:hypothetical protein